MREIVSQITISDVSTTSGSNSRLTWRSSKRHWMPLERTMASLTWPRRSRRGLDNLIQPSSAGWRLTTLLLRLWQLWPRIFRLSFQTLTKLTGSSREIRREKTKKKIFLRVHPKRTRASMCRLRKFSGESSVRMNDSRVMSPWKPRTIRMP